MSNYRVFETDQFQRNIRDIARSGNASVLQKLRRVVYPALAQRPHFGPNIKKLKDWQPETWRYRIGSWRFFYEVDEKSKMVFMTAASHRGSAY